MEEVLTKLPVPALLKSVLVSKLWYYSIHNKPKGLIHSHFLQSQKHPDVTLSLLTVRDDEVVEMTDEPGYGCHFFKFTAGIYSDDDENALEFRKFRGGLVAGHDIWELVGYCHGLPCLALVGNYSTGYIILDPNRKDFMYIYPATAGECISSASVICHGFGFDPSAKEYKLVSNFRTSKKELNIVVFTLGAKSWRNVTATSTPISGHGSRPITKIRAPTGSGRSSIFCTTCNSSSSSRCLVWKIMTTLGEQDLTAVNNEMEMLLSFNLHDEKFQFIQLPAKSTIDEQQKKHLLVDYPHLLEFKGSPCIARVEKNQGMEVIILIVP